LNNNLNNNDSTAKDLKSQNASQGSLHGYTYTAGSYVLVTSFGNSRANQPRVESNTRANLQIVSTTQGSTHAESGMVHANRRDSAVSGTAGTVPYRVASSKLLFHRPGHENKNENKNQQEKKNQQSQTGQNQLPPYSGLLADEDDRLVVSELHLVSICALPVFSKLEKHAYCSTDLVVLSRWTVLLASGSAGLLLEMNPGCSSSSSGGVSSMMNNALLSEELGRLFLKMMKMLHLCDYPVSELVSMLAHATYYWESKVKSTLCGGKNTSSTGHGNNTASAAPASAAHAIGSKASMGSSSNGSARDGSAASSRGPPHPQNSMGTTEQANILIILCFIAHSYIHDECCPLRIWWQYLFKRYCSLRTLNHALVRILLILDWKLRVEDIGIRYRRLLKG